MKPSNARLCDCRQREQRQPLAAANLVAFGAKAKFGAWESLCKKNWLWGVRTISLQAKALPGTSILSTLIIHPPMISTLTISMLMILELTISTRLVSIHTISTLTIAWAWQSWQSPGKSIPTPVAVVAVSRQSRAAHQTLTRLRGSRGSRGSRF